jgi:hypothetical protein
MQLASVLSQEWLDNAGPWPGWFRPSRPGEWPGVGVVERDIGVDRGHEVRHVPEDATPDALGGQLAEPALDQVEPGRARRGEVEMEARVSGRGEPHHDVCVGVRPVVVDDEMEVQLGRVAPVEPTQVGEELLVQMSGVALADDRAFEQPRCSANRSAGGRCRDRASG